jgi:hypothetical protein
MTIRTYPKGYHVRTNYQELCDILLRKYSKQLNITNPPRLFTSAKEFNIADTCGGTKLGQHNLKASGLHGLYCNECKILYSNSKANKTVCEIAESIIHELIHHKWFHLPHGKGYDKRVQLIMNGKRYK